MLKNSVKAALVGVSALALVISAAAEVKKGSYDLVWDETVNGVDAETPVGAKLRLTADFDGADSFNSGWIDVGNLTRDEVLDEMRDALEAADPAIEFDDRGDSGINVTKREGKPITEVDTDFNFTMPRGGEQFRGVDLDGSVREDYLISGAAWSVNFSEADYWAGGVHDPGDLTLSGPGFDTVSTFLPAGVTPVDAAVLLAGALTDAGFSDVSLLGSGTGVSFLTGPDGEIIETIDTLGFGGTNIHIGLGIPATVPEPGSLALLCVGGLAMRPRRR